MEPTIRTIRADEWERVRELRLAALRDPLAHLAFLESYEERATAPAEFWQGRAEGATGEADACQWVAKVDGEWVAQIVVILFRAGQADYYGQQLEQGRAALVGVYVRPQWRRRGLLEELLRAAEPWVLARGFDELVLDVHADNVPALRAYERIGFVDRGERIDFEGDRDIRMRKRLGAA